MNYSHKIITPPQKMNPNISMFWASHLNLKKKIIYYVKSRGKDKEITWITTFSDNQKLNIIHRLICWSQRW